MSNLPASMSRLLIAVVAGLGLLVVGWGVVGLHTSPDLSLDPRAEPEDRVEVVCRSVSDPAAEGGVDEIRVGGKQLDDDAEGTIPAGESVASVVAKCHQARTGRLAIAVQSSLLGSAVLAAAVALLRRRLEYLAP
ncbi:hypothetical protein [Nocardioides sp. 1609]|uniref:hypothetical protein n=1 Tax=Nocardioides sp. 1609 TaxID=2508327 RepID=UPI0010700ACC|nr:hypothetical protein [Nocardioides sp. 1609]